MASSPIPAVICEANLGHSSSAGQVPSKTEREPTALAIPTPLHTFAVSFSDFDAFEPAAFDLDAFDFDMVYGIEKGSSHPAAMSPGNSMDPAIATRRDLQTIQDAHPLPPKRATSFYRSVRWAFLSAYRKVFGFVLLTNVIAMAVFLSQIKRENSIATYRNAVTAAAANLLAALLMRNEHVVNLLFRLVCTIPVHFPMSVRRRAAKIYSYGGVHSACGVSGTMWYIVFAALTVTQYTSSDLVEVGLAVTTGLTLVLLLVILFFAHPKMRIKLHNHFEVTHRFAGWTAIFILWLQTMLLIVSNARRDDQDIGTVTAATPSFWCLVAITVLLIYPWTRLRKRSCRIESLSKHATRLHFDYTTLGSCMAVRLADAPLTETHAFASIPNYEDEDAGFSILISNAGDWTNKMISNPPTSIWVKGAPIIGVLRVALVFTKVLVIATGSGIGPCLSFFQSNVGRPMRVLWSTPSPQRTFGERIVTAVLRADPRAVIVDTKRTGRPDLVALAYAMVVESGCEAAVVISNPSVTRKVVYGLETRGVPAFGPIFDS